MNDTRLGQTGNERAKKLIELRPYGTATASFLCIWEGDSRVPEAIQFPDGLEKKVGYMRDGILTFIDGNLAATYERVLDEPSKVKAIVVYYRVKDPKVCN